MGTKSIAVIGTGFLGSELATAMLLKVGTKSIAVIAGFLGSELATAMVFKGGYQIYSCDRDRFPRQ